MSDDEQYAILGRAVVAYEEARREQALLESHLAHLGELFRLLGEAINSPASSSARLTLQDNRTVLIRDLYTGKGTSGTYPSLEELQQLLFDREAGAVRVAELRAKQRDLGGL